MKHQKLTPEEEQVIVYKGTERPFSGKYLNNKEKGLYRCRRCGAALYRSEDKFDSGCGWPSFDDELAGAVIHRPDRDGKRVEIICAACEGHLGHVFTGEGLTDKNTRHCVNSISLHFEPAESASQNRAVFAAGCFWGVEHLIKTMHGVTSTRVGYTGGITQNPDYRSVCSGTTGHIEAVEVEFNPEKASFADLCRLFFEIHDFSQQDGQGPDIGEQYKSVIFYADADQQKIATEITEQLRNMGHKVATELRPMHKFWPAEDYHQEYYIKTGKTPYCHIRRKIF
ncbi:MAG: bifunctional methionine sulfoxide reductase B/A protein [Candidatus Riflebacteria bacterium]|nr:bifunctional methionine sulfoxide reductase B/A protein [Candidatus Riflebacteria bacterium]